jgi:hypothetical protein
MAPGAGLITSVVKIDVNVVLARTRVNVVLARTRTV